MSLDDDGNIKDTGVVAEKYTAPSGGIPEADLDSSVQTKLNSGGVPDADATTKGVVQLTGDLSGTSASPTIATGVIDDTHIAGGAAIAQSKIADLTTDLGGKQDGNADLTAISGLTPSNDDVLQRKSGAWVNRTVAQVKTDLNLQKSDVGLGSADDTSDLNKPISTAAQTALDAKTTGAASSTDNAVARYDGATGKTIQNSGVTITDAGVLTSPGGVDASAWSVSNILTVPIMQMRGGTAATNPDLQFIPALLANAFYGINNPAIGFGTDATNIDTFLHRDGADALRTRGVMRGDDGVGASDFTTKSQLDALDALIDTKKTSYDIDVRDYGAVSDVRTFTDANVASGSSTLTSATANFVAGDVGKTIIVAMMGAANVSVTTTITARTNSTTITLATTNTSGANVVNVPAALGTDNTTAFVNALAAARTAGVYLYVPQGNYAINGNLLTAQGASPAGFKIRGDGALGTRLYRFFDNGSTVMFFLWGQALGSPPTLTATAAKGTQTITVSSTTNMSAGTWLFIQDNDQPVLGVDNTQQAIIGEFAKVQTVNSATSITLTGQLSFAYGNTNTTVHIQRMANGVAISGIDFVNPIPSYQQNGSNIASLVGCENIEIKDCRITEMESNGFSLQQCVNAKFLNLDISNTNLETTPYPILLRTGTSHVLIDQCRMVRGRHMVTTTQNTTSAGPKFIVVSNCIAWQCTNTPFDHHPGASHFTYINCTVTNQNIIPPVNPRSGGQTNGLGDAFQIRGPDCMLINCNVNGAFRGITMHNGSHRTKIFGCRIENTDKGIYTVNSDDLRIENVEIINPRVNGFEIDPVSDGWTVTKLYMKNVRVDGNPSGAAFAFDRWHNNFYIDPSCVAPDATTKMSGRTPTTVASAGTLTVPANGETFQVTGTTNITGMAVNQSDHGRLLRLRFTGALTLSNGTGLTLAAPINTSAGFVLMLWSDGTTWYET